MIEEKNKETKKNGDKKEYRDEQGRFVKGYEGGPGRTPGLRDWKTDFNEAVKITAKQTGQDESEIRTDLMVKGISEARKGNYNFWKDIIERSYGKTKEEVDVNLTTRVKTLKNIDENLRKAIEDE